MLLGKKPQQTNKRPEQFRSLLCLGLCYVTCVISDCRGLIFGYKFSFWRMAVFKCQQFCTVSLPVFKNRNLVSLASNYLVFLLQPDLFSWGFFFFFLLFFFFSVKFWGICLFAFLFSVVLFSWKLFKLGMWCRISPYPYPQPCLRCVFSLLSRSSRLFNTAKTQTFCIIHFLNQ